MLAVIVSSASGVFLMACFFLMIVFLQVYGTAIKEKTYDVSDILFEIITFRWFVKFNAWWYYYYPPSADITIVRILTNHFEYYNSLNHENRRRFAARVNSFMHSKHFVAEGNFRVTEKMKVLISACAAQITFGLDYFTLNYFYRIHVYPEAYHYKHYKVKFRGHVSEYGNIHLSWHHFERGYLFPEDGTNLGLHEMAHALKLHAMQHQVDFRFYDNHATWTKIAKVEKKQIRVNQQHPLRKWVGRDLDELWAVSVECFFEMPNEFAKSAPDLYEAMMKKLNQDPRNKAEPVLKSGIKIITR